MDDLELLLAHADDQRPVLDGGLPLESAPSFLEIGRALFASTRSVGSRTTRR
jgi:hypothetical protein